MVRKISSFIILFLFLMVTVFCVSSFAVVQRTWNSTIISHEMRVKEEEHYPPIPNPDHHLTSLPEGEGNSPMAVAIIFARKNLVWEKEKEFIFLGAWKLHSEDFRKKSLEIVEVLKYVADGTFPNEPIVSMGFFPLINELMIYFEPSKWKDREFHENAAKKINKKLMEYEGTK